MGVEALKTLLLEADDRTGNRMWYGASAAILLRYSDRPPVKIALPDDGGGGLAGTIATVAFAKADMAALVPR